MDTETTYKPCYHSVLPAPCGGEPYAHQINVSPCDGGKPLRLWDFYDPFCAQLPKGNSESTNRCLAPTDSSLEEDL